MTSASIHEALHNSEIETGKLLQDVKFRSAGRTVRGIRAAELSVDSPISRLGAKVLLATNSNVGNGHEIDMAIGVEPIDEQRALIGIDPRESIARGSTQYLRRVLEATAEQSKVKELVVDDPGSAGVPAEMLEQVGFHQADDGTLHYRVAA